MPINFGTTYVWKRSIYGQVRLFILWEGFTNFRRPRGGGEDNAEDRDEIWHACYWPEENCWYL